MKKILIPALAITAIAIGIFLATPDKPLIIDNLFTSHQEDAGLARMDRDTVLKKKKRLDINKDVLKKIKKEKSDSLVITIDGHKLKLKRVHIHPRVITSEGQEIDYPEGLFYQGLKDDSVTSAISFLDSTANITYAIKGKSNTYVVPEESHYVLYNDTDVLIQNPNKDCKMLQIPDSLRQHAPQRLAESVGGKCFSMKWEVMNEIYVGKGSNMTATIDFMTGIFNQSSLLYANSGVTITLGTLYIWTTPDPYGSATTTDGALDAFGATGSPGLNFTESVSVLIGVGRGGGIAYVGTACIGVKRFQMAYCGISLSYSLVPAYSWTVMVVTHEAGHLAGLNHSHDCVWNGNNTKIDCCGDHAGYSSGTCGADIPDPVGGGTVMSYCDLRAVGVSFYLGFGPVAGPVLKSKVDALPCLTTCITAPCQKTTSYSKIPCHGDTTLIEYIDSCGIRLKTTTIHQCICVSDSIFISKVNCDSAGFIATWKKWNCSNNTYQTFIDSSTCLRKKVTCQPQYNVGLQIAKTP